MVSIKNQTRHLTPGLTPSPETTGSCPQIRAQGINAELTKYVAVLVNFAMELFTKDLLSVVPLYSKAAVTKLLSMTEEAEIAASTFSFICQAAKHEDIFAACFAAKVPTIRCGCSHPPTPTHPTALPRDPGPHALDTGYRAPGLPAPPLVLQDPALPSFGLVCRPPSSRRNSSPGFD